MKILKSERFYSIDDAEFENMAVKGRNYQRFGG